MINRILMLFSVVGTLLLSAAAYSHHSIAATYQRESMVELDGRLVQFVFRNPHSFIHIEVENDEGEAQRWAIEWTGTAALVRRGMNAATLRPGDHLMLTVNPSRAPGETRGLMLSLQRPSDGLAWGNLPDEVVD